MKEQPATLWTRFRVVWDILERLYASVPGDPEMITKWLEARKPKVRPPDARPMAEIQAEVVRSVLGDGPPPADGELTTEQAPEEYSLLVFQSHAGCLAIRADTIRAHLKDCARVISAQYLGRIEGERAFSTRVKNGLYQDPQAPWIPLVREDGTAITVPDGWEDRAVHAWSPRGQVNALKRIAYVVQPRLAFTLLILGDSVSEGDLATVMQYGGVHGYGGERSRDGGKYVAQIVRE